MRAVTRGRVATVSTGVLLNSSAVARVTATDSKGVALTLLPNSRVSDTVTGRRHTAIVYNVDAGLCKMSLRIPIAQLHHGVGYTVHITATRSTGQAAGATIRFHL